MEQFTRYLGLFQHLLRADEDSAARSIAGWTDSDWQQFLTFLHEHRLREFFWYSTRRLPLLEQNVPPAVQKKLARFATRCSERIAALARLRDQAGEALDSDGISWLILKGSALIARFYPPGQMRHQGDVDLLVREEDVPAAVRSLKSTGLMLRGNRPEIRPGRMRAEHAATLSNGNLSVDLHWKLRSGPDYRISMDDVWDSRQPCANMDGLLETVSDEYLLVLLCLSVAHDLGRGGIRLKSFLDLYHVLQQLGSQLETTEFWERRRSEQIARICRATLNVVDRILPQTVPSLPSPDENRNILQFVSAAEHSAGGREFHQSHAEHWHPANQGPLQNPTADCTPEHRTELQLVANPRGAIDNFLWLAEQQQLWKPAHLRWYISKQLHHPGRIPLAFWRMLCFGARLAPWAVTQSPTTRLKHRQTAPPVRPHRRAA
ncbi:MAG: nucleotidyltransferase family protein [Planctomycetaceae bacterium]|nr:nucleotidyltransferase family protein [Planctomycetaceae bacterium]